MDTKKFVSHDIPVIWTQIQNEEDSKALNKPCGQYVTLETGPLDRLASVEKACACLTEQLRHFLEPYFGKTLCVCGLGNQDMHPDALGPEVARRFRPKLLEVFHTKPSFEKVAMICSSVNGHTNLSTDVIMAGISSAIHAACVLIVDSSTCDDVERLCSSICLTDNGMHTYFDTADLCQSTIGVPVITVGVPTAIHVPSLYVSRNMPQDILLTTFHISDVIKVASFIVACAIAQVAFPELGYEECKQCIGFALNNVI